MLLLIKKLQVLLLQGQAQPGHVGIADLGSRIMEVAAGGVTRERTGDSAWNPLSREPPCEMEPRGGAAVGAGGEGLPLPWWARVSCADREDTIK